jgi:cytochrome c nitrite reductase small subunit
MTGHRAILLAAAFVGLVAGIGSFTFVYHTPPGLVPKYMTKAQNGFWHSFYFTTGRYPDPLRITPRNQAVTERACRKCHAELTLAIDPSHTDSGIGGIQCASCHNDVGHIE